jgi:hypothetical protein
MDWKRLGLALGAMLAVATEAVAVPLELAYQGTIFDGEGAALTGEHTLTVTIYAAADGTEVLWREAHALTLSDGYFSIALGLGDAVGDDPHPPLDSLAASESLFLAVKVDDQPESTERLALLSVPFALVAGTAENVPSDEDIEELARGVCYDTSDELTEILDPIYAGAVAWDRIESFPSACEAGEAVTAVGAQLTCSSFDATADTIADDGVITLGSETAGSYDDTPDVVADDGVITLGIETSGSYDDTPDVIADDGVITLGSETAGSYDDTPDVIADDGVITLGAETSGSYDDTPDTIADDGVIALGLETSGSYDDTPDTIADDGVIVLGAETSGSYDDTPDTIADDGVISDAEASDVLTIDNGVLHAPTSGFVGIGTTTPDEMLHVEGNVLATGDTHVFGTHGGLNAIKLPGDDPALRWSLNASSIVLNGVLNNILNLGWNVTELASHEVPTEPTLHLQFESRFHTLPGPGAPELMEFILAYRSIDGQNRRPYQVGVDRETHRSNHQFQGSIVFLDSTGTDGVMSLEDGGNLYLQGGTSLFKAGNNETFLRQQNSAGNQWMELLRLDDSDKLVVSGSGTDTVFSGRVGILTSSPNFALEVVGAAAKPGGGSWTDSSDRRLKHNIKPLEGALATLLALRGVTYEWNEPGKHGNLTGPQRGMIAQEVEEVVPEWVGTDPQGMKTLTFRGFEALTVESLRTLKAENDALAADNAALKSQLDELGARLDALDGGGKQASLAAFSPWLGMAPMGLLAYLALRRRRPEASRQAASKEVR